MRNEKITPLYERLSRDDELQGESNSMSGKHMTGQVPYGYLWADEKRQSWVVDNDAAAIVRRIFSLTMAGYGPSRHHAGG